MEQVQNVNDRGASILPGASNSSTQGRKFYQSSKVLKGPHKEVWHGKCQSYSISIGHLRKPRQGACGKTSGGT